MQSGPCDIPTVQAAASHLLWSPRMCYLHRRACSELQQGSCGWSEWKAPSSPHRRPASLGVARNWPQFSHRVRPEQGAIRLPRFTECKSLGPGSRRSFLGDPLRLQGLQRESATSCLCGAWERRDLERHPFSLDPHVGTRIPEMQYLFLKTTTTLVRSLSLCPHTSVYRPHILIPLLTNKNLFLVFIFTNMKMTDISFSYNSL